MKKFLVVQTKEIGDVLVSTALCNNLKQAYPQARVDYLVMDYCAGMAEGNPYIDNLITLDKKQKDDWRYLWQLMKAIRQTAYDTVINSQGQIIGLLTCLFSGANTRIGFDSLPWRLGHNRVVRFGKDTDHQGNAYMVDDRFSLLAPLQLPKEDRNYYLWLSEPETQRGREKLQAAGIDLELPLITFGVNSKGAYKCWPIDHFAELAEMMIDSYQAQILVYCGPGEEAYNRQLKKRLPEAKSSYVFDNIATSSIRELAGLIVHSKYFIGNDTGPRHIAQALEVPSLSITAPFGDKRIANPDDHHKFRTIDIPGALKLTMEQWDNMRSGVQRGTPEEQDVFRKLTPCLVWQSVKQQIDELGLLK
ncbi:glycosyltransferase family 9 protein [Zobellella denitrificans]